MQFQRHLVVFFEFIDVLMAVLPYFLESHFSIMPPHMSDKTHSMKHVCMSCPADPSTSFSRTELIMQSPHIAPKPEYMAKPKNVKLIRNRKLMISLTSGNIKNFEILSAKSWSMCLEAIIWNIKNVNDVRYVN